MPLKHIKVPAPIQFTDEDGEAIDKSVSFFDFHKKFLKNHPSSIETYDSVSKATAIMEALNAAEKAESDIMMIAAEDQAWWAERVKTPKQLFVREGTPTTIAGYGYAPWFTLNLKPFLDAVVGATDKAPVKQAAKPAKTAEKPPG